MARSFHKRKNNINKKRSCKFVNFDLCKYALGWTPNRMSRQHMKQRLPYVYQLKTVLPNCYLGCLSYTVITWMHKKFRRPINLGCVKPYPMASETDLVDFSPRNTWHAYLYWLGCFVIKPKYLQTYTTAYWVLLTGSKRVHCWFLGYLVYTK